MSHIRIETGSKKEKREKQNIIQEKSELEREMNVVAVLSLS